MKTMVRHLMAVLLSASVSLVMAAGAPLSPAGIAYLKAEQHRIDRQFAERAAQVAGVPVSVVSAGMPHGPRITDTGRRVINAVEQHTQTPLSDAQRAQIQAADDERKAALARARDEAAKR